MLVVQAVLQYLDSSQYGVEFGAPWHRLRIALLLHHFALLDGQLDARKRAVDALHEIPLEGLSITVNPCFELIVSWFLNSSNLGLIC
jgi:hypothetical protein